MCNYFMYYITINFQDGLNLLASTQGVERIWHQAKLSDTYNQLVYDKCRYTLQIRSFYTKLISNLHYYTYML